jgi:antitoxin component of RelBE/YafQ-DinJ toxin-antitoxin module
MARKVYIDPTRINFKVERELKERAEVIFENAGTDMTSFFTLMLQKLVDGKIRLSPLNAASSHEDRRIPSPLSEA